MSTERLAFWRSFVIYLVGTILIWSALLIGSFLVLAGTAQRNTEILFILGAGAVLFLIGGAEWYLTFRQPSTKGSNAPTSDRDAGARERTGLIVYFVGVTVVWLVMSIAIAISLSGTPLFGTEMALVLILILLWYVALMPLLIFRDLKSTQAA